MSTVKRKQLRWMLLLMGLASAWLLLQAASPVARVRELEDSVHSRTVIDGWVYDAGISGIASNVFSVRGFQLDAPRQWKAQFATVRGASVAMVPVINRDGVFYAVEERLAAAQILPRQPALPPNSRAWSRMPRLRMWRLPLSGATAKEILPNIRTSAVRFGERRAYWLRSPLTGPGASIITSGDAIPVAELMVSDLEGGAARKLATVQVDSQFMVCEDGVYWMVRKGAEEKLVHVRIADGAVDEIPAATPPEQMLEPMVELGENWLWLERESETDGAGRRLVIAGPGSPRRVLVAPGARASLDRLTTDGKDAYCHLLEDPAGGSSVGQARRTLCRVRVGEPARLERLVRLPQETRDSGSIAGGWLHHGYYYFTRHEKHENWLMWWGEGLEPRRVSALYRVRLPN